jgi:chitinase
MGTYTTSVLYGSTTVANSVTKLITTTTTLTLTLPTVTTNEISYSNVNISRNEETSSLWVEVSVPVSPVTVTLPDGGEGSTTRVLTLPAWPSVTNGPPADDDNDNGDDDDDDDWSSILDPITTTAALTETDPPETTLPTWSTYPPYIVEPVEDEDDDDDDNDYDHGGGILVKISCKLWFFNICTSKIKSLRWILPPGIYLPGTPPPDIIGPGPPPGPGPGPQFTIKPPLPP